MNEYQGAERERVRKRRRRWWSAARSRSHHSGNTCKLPTQEVNFHLEETREINNKKEQENFFFVLEVQKKRQQILWLTFTNYLEAAPSSNMNGNVIAQRSHLLKKCNWPVTPYSFKYNKWTTFVILVHRQWKEILHQNHSMTSAFLGHLQRFTLFYSYFNTKIMQL